MLFFGRQFSDARLFLNADKEVLLIMKLELSLSSIRKLIAMNCGGGR